MESARLRPALEVADPALAAVGLEVVDCPVGNVDGHCDLGVAKVGPDGIDTDDVDVVTLSVEYSRCSNSTVFVVPYLGHNFGVGEETGSLLEHRL